MATSRTARNGCFTGGETGDLVWRGAISDLLPRPKQAEKRFRKGARKLLKNFPPVD